MSAHVDMYWSDAAVRDRAEAFIDSIIAINVRHGMGRCDEATRKRAIESAAEQERAFHFKNRWPQ